MMIGYCLKCREYRGEPGSTKWDFRGLEMSGFARSVAL